MARSLTYKVMKSGLAMFGSGASLVGMVLVLFFFSEKNQPKEKDLLGAWVWGSVKSREESSIVIEFKESGRFSVKWDSDLVGVYHYEMADEWRVDSDRVELVFDMVFESGNRFQKRKVFRYSVSEGKALLTLISDQDGEMTGALEGAVTLSRLSERQ